MDHCSNSVDWRRSNFRIPTPVKRATTPAWEMHSQPICPVLPATHEAAAAAAGAAGVLSLIREEVEWAKYRPNKLVGVNGCDWHVIEARVVMLFACVGDGWVAKKPWPTCWNSHHLAITFITHQSTRPMQSWLCHRPNDRTGWYNKTNPNVNSNLDLTTKVWILGKTNL